MMDAKITQTVAMPLALGAMAGATLLGQGGLTAQTLVMALLCTALVALSVLVGLRFAEG